jgi:ribonuclease P protein component
MLSRQYRLRQTRDISRVYAKGRYGGAAQLQVKALKNNLDTTRVAIVVAKKVSKKATVRNRIRRQIAGGLQGMWQTLTPGYDIVVSVREDVSGISATELAQQLKAALAKSGCIRD